MVTLNYHEHFEALQKDLQEWPDHPGRGGLRVVEARLAIAWRYRLTLPLDRADLTTVWYWRWQWPRFECVVKYQELRYTLALCPPKGTAEEQRAVILEESCRRLRHIELNPGLFAYIQSGRTNRDFRLFGRNPTTAHLNSEWLAGLWAFDRYERYLEGRFPRFTPGYRPGRAALGP
jgi:hypothetical protein